MHEEVWRTRTGYPGRREGGQAFDKFDSFYGKRELPKAQVSVRSSYSTCDSSRADNLAPGKAEVPRAELLVLSIDAKVS